MVVICIKTNFNILEAIQRQIDLIQQPVCHKAPNPEECNTHLPDFWKAIAMALFNPDNGWFSPSEFCAVRLYFSIWLLD